MVATDLGETEVRQLIYGRRRSRYRVLFTMDEETVTILRVLHGARAPIRR
jgi:plasmid stabilization system protein ParE